MAVASALPTARIVDRGEAACMMLRCAMYIHTQEVSAGSFPVIYLVYKAFCSCLVTGGGLKILKTKIVRSMERVKCIYWRSGTWGWTFWVLGEWGPSIYEHLYLVV